MAPSLLPLLEERSELGRHLRQGLTGEREGALPLAYDDVDLAPRVVRVRVVVARVAAAALATLERGQRAAFGHGEERRQIERHVPARVVRSPTVDVRARRAVLECFD